MNEQQILETCLAKMAAGVSMDDCLTAYPQQAATIGPMLHAAQQLQALGDLVAPPEFRNVTRVRLLNQMDALPPQPQAKQAASAQPHVWRPALAPAWARALAMSVIIVVGLLLSAYAVEAALPGDRLYAAKLAGENVILALSPSQPDLQLRLARRRLQEIESLQAQNRHQQTPVALARYRQLMALWQQSRALDENARGQASVRIQVQIDLLRKLEQAAPQQQTKLFADERQEVQRLLADPEPDHGITTPPSSPTPTTTPTATSTPTVKAAPILKDGPEGRTSPTIPPTARVTPTHTRTPHDTPPPPIHTRHPERTPDPNRTSLLTRTPPPLRTPEHTPPPTRTPDPHHTPPPTRSPEHTPPPTRNPERTPPLRTPDPERTPQHTPDPNRPPLPTHTPEPTHTPPPSTPDPEQPPPRRTPHHERTPHPRGG
ncbi:MAG: hypothetical protein J5I90_00215 [Caldilineales bacterium]|nr:hypothetical protein [Caldilineales bacterium]